MRRVEGKTTIQGAGQGAGLALAMLIAITGPALGQSKKTAAPAAPAALAPPVDTGIAVGVKPIGNPGDWFPPESYPAEAKAAAEEGRTEFSLDIDAAGRITGCNIVQSSGSDLLDSTTCSQLIGNGRFKPALDRNGKPMPGSWTSAMRWELAEAKTQE
ncbi:MAG: energy transducer TonB [Sphingomonas sp.]|nr:energy transducer TonB [Sphingomonas sp.]